MTLSRSAWKVNHVVSDIKAGRHSARLTFTAKKHHSSFLVTFQVSKPCIVKNIIAEYLCFGAVPRTFLQIIVTSTDGSYFSEATALHPAKKKKKETHNLKSVSLTGVRYLHVREFKTIRM